MSLPYEQSLRIIDATRPCRASGCQRSSQSSHQEWTLQASPTGQTGPLACRPSVCSSRSRLAEPMVSADRRARGTSARRTTHAVHTADAGVARPQRSSPPEYSRMRKILIADDNAAVRRFMRAAVEDEPGYVILEAANGREAVRLALQEHPDLAFIDVDMPEMDGFQVCAAIKADQAARTTRVVLCTGSGDTANEGMAAGADAFLPKPCTIQQVQAKLLELSTG
jgi:CheY-like chemotaxis protein